MSENAQMTVLVLLAIGLVKADLARDGSELVDQAL
jgi:hypothetical protein